jgi:subtilisin family serine protease
MTHSAWAGRVARLHRPADIATAGQFGQPRRRYLTTVSHRLLRGALVPLTTGLAAVAAVLGVLGSAPAAGAAPAAAGDAIRAQEWWLAGLHVTRAWHESDGAGIIVAVLGTGVAAGHPDLAGEVITGPDYSGSAPFGRGPGGSYWGAEGTAVAGIIAGHGYDGHWGIGIVGIAPAAKILSVRVTLEFNDPLASDQAVSQRLPDAIAEGIRYAVNHGARVIDLPLDPGTLGLTGSGDPAAAGGSAAERAAVEYALHKNAVLVAPAGDDGQGPGIVNYPAAYRGVIAVGATGRDGQLASFSSRRSYASLTAPGVSLVAAAPPDGYGQFSSSAAASGIVAGVAALIVSEFPHLTVAQVTRALVDSTVATAGGTGLPPVPGRSGSGAGYGTVDAARAIKMAAVINSASQARRPAVPPGRPHKPARPAVASPPRTSAGDLAGSVLRDAVAAVGALIVLLALGLMIVRSRRRRGAAPARPQARARGQHEHHRADRGTASPVTPAPNGAGPGPHARPQLAGRARAAAGRWPSPGGWQGGGIGEIDYAPGTSSRPVMTPAPRTITGYRASRGAGAEPGPAGPPWEPAPEPDRMIGPLPAAAASPPRPEPGPGIRIPGDMVPGAAPWPAATEDAAPGARSDLATPPADFDLSTPAFGLTPAAFGFAAPPPGPDAPARDSPGFAAAPVPADQATAPAAGLAPPGGQSGPAAAADPSYIWDLAATDVFPAAGPGQAAETAPPDAVPPSPDDPPGDGGS